MPNFRRKTGLQSGKRLYLASKITSSTNKVDSIFRLPCDNNRVHFHCSSTPLILYHPALAWRIKSPSGCRRSALRTNAHLCCN